MGFLESSQETVLQGVLKAWQSVRQWLGHGTLWPFTFCGDRIDRIGCGHSGIRCRHFIVNMKFNNEGSPPAGNGLGGGVRTSRQRVTSWPSNGGYECVVGASTIWIDDQIVKFVWFCRQVAHNSRHVRHCFKVVHQGSILRSVDIVSMGFNTASFWMDSKWPLEGSCSQQCMYDTR